MPYGRITYNKIAGSDECISGVRKEATPRLQIINKGKNKWCKQLTEGFCSDSGATCVMGPGEEGDSILKLAGTADIC